jgi:hypothetical protein
MGNNKHVSFGRYEPFTKRIALSFSFFTLGAALNERKKEKKL